MIKKLGTELCQVDENLLSENALNQNKKKSNKDAALKGDMSATQADSEN